MTTTTARRKELVDRRNAPLATPSDLHARGTKQIAGALNAVLADVFALYLKTKSFHWHMSGPHFRDYHLLFDEQAEQLFAITDAIAERVRKIGERTLTSIGAIARSQHVLDNDAGYVEPLDMLAELREDNKALTGRLRETHDLCNGMSRRPVCLRCGLTKRSGALGSCSRRAATENRRGTSPASPPAVRRATDSSSRDGIASAPSHLAQSLRHGVRRASRTRGAGAMPGRQPDGGVVLFPRIAHESP
jgi:starvation-inducible DNA-binding protein